MLTTSALGGYHLWMGVAAIALGPFLFLRRKGDRLHRVLGTVWVFLMVSVNVSALSMYQIGGVTPFHVLAVANLSVLLPGYVAIRSGARIGAARARRRHLRLMGWAYAGVVLAAVGQITLRIGGEDAVPAMAAAILVGLGIAGLIIRAAARADRRRGSPAS